MSVIIRLQNLPLTASSIDIRNFFHGLSIPDGGVHIVGGINGDSFIAFSTDEDARQAMRLSGQHLKDSRVSLLLSSRNEMYKVIEQARLTAIGGPQASSLPSSSAMSPQNANNPPSHLASQSQQGSSSNGHGHMQHQQHQHPHYQQQQHHNSNSNPMSPTSTGSSANDYLKGFSGNTSTGATSADLSSNPALLFSTMSAIPSATLGGANANPYLSHQPGQAFPGIPSATQQNQNSGLSFPPNLTNAPAPGGFPNGNPFLNPPPSMTGMQLPFPAGLLPGASTANPLGGPPSSTPGGMQGLTQTTAGLLGLSSNVMNTTMSMAGLAANHHPINPFANPPPRMSLMNSGAGTTGSGSGSTPTLSGSFGGHMQHHHQQQQQQQQQHQRQNNGNFPQQGMHNNFNPNHNAGGMGGGGGMNRDMGNNRAHQHQQHQPPHHQQHQQQQQQHQQQSLLGGPRPPFMLGHNVAEKQSRFQPASLAGPQGGPGGRMDMNSMGRDINARDRRSRSRSRERKDALLSRRRRSRSRDKERNNDRDRRRRRSKSRSNSRSRSRDRTAIVKGPTRRDSRDKREERRRSDSSPEKSSQEKGDSDRERRSRREQEASPVPSSSNTTTDEWPGAKLTGIPNDASYREIKEFIRVEVMGGSDGVVRLYDEGIAFLKLENPSEFPRVYRSNGRKLRGSAVSIEGITMEIWTQEYKLNKSRIERDIDREREERERERERDSGRPSRDRERDSRTDRHTHNSHSASSHHRSSRFSNASQSSCIAIRGLAPTITRQELTTRYLNETPCQDVVLIAAPTPTNRHSVTAFVEFESAQIAKSVTDSITRSPFGASLVVESCDSDDLQKAKARTSGSSAMAPSGGGGAVLGSRGDRDSRIPTMQAAAGNTPDTKSIFELDLGLDDETTTVIMKGAPPNISERDVFDFFSDIGLTPTNVRIMYDSDGQCSGQVICEFPDNNKAKRATTKDGMLFGRGQISVSLLPNRSRVSGGSVESAPQQNSFIRDYSQQQRPPRTGLLGAGPLRGAPAGMNSSPRFPNTNNSPNIFEQALQQQSGPVRPPPPLGSGGRGRGGPNGTGERMSRFNNARSDFRGNGMGRGRGAGGLGKKDENQTMSDDEMALFNKKGCVLGLENIPYKASMDDILGYLEENLNIRIAPDRIIRRYDEMQKPTGDARVAFDTEFEAKLACERLNGTYMWKRVISSAVIE